MPCRAGEGPSIPEPRRSRSARNHPWKEIRPSRIVSSNVCSDISPALHAAKPVRTQRHGEHQAHHAAPSAGGSRRSAVLSTLSHSSLLSCAPVLGVEAGSSWADPRGPLNSYFKRTYGKTFSIVTVPPVKLRPAAPVCAPFFVRA